MILGVCLENAESSIINEYANKNYILFTEILATVKFCLFILKNTVSTFILAICKL